VRTTIPFRFETNRLPAIKQQREIICATLSGNLENENFSHSTVQTDVT